MGKTRQILARSGAIHEISPTFRSASPLQIATFWKQWARYPDSRLWLPDGVVRHNHALPDAPGFYRPAYRPVIFVSWLLTVGAAFALNVVIFRGKNKPVYPEDYELQYETGHLTREGPVLTPKTPVDFTNIRLEE